MNIISEYKKTYTSPREVAIILWTNAILSFEMGFEFEVKELDNKEFNKKYIAIEDIISKVCAVKKISRTDILKGTKRNFVKYRQIAMYFSRYKANENLENIGIKFNGKDHSTVIYAVKTVNNLMKSDNNYRKEIEELQNIII